MSDDQREREVDYFTGRYDELKLLATSPRLRGAALELVKSRAYEIKEKLEARGVKFTEASDG